jgi:ribosome biogenesis GTPase
MELEALGWDEAWREAFAPHAERGCLPGRVISDYGRLCHVWAAWGPTVAEVVGPLAHAGPEDRPVAGDWVALERRSPPLIRAVLERRSTVGRGAAGERTERQVVAANLDWLMIVDGLEAAPSQRRLERLLILAWEGGARPALVLNKVDLCPDPDRVRREIEATHPGLPVRVVSAARGDGLHTLRPFLEGHQTVALVGRSGVGKSSLINRLLGAEEIETRPVREADGRGRHTTTRKELRVLPSGGVLIDTPGLREVALWDDGGALRQTFGDVEGLARDCAFRDCSHTVEPRCAVRRAVANGELEEGRLASYLKLRAELRHTTARRDGLARLEEKRRWKAIHKSIRRFHDRK